MTREDYAEFMGILSNRRLVPCSLNGVETILFDELQTRDRELAEAENALWDAVKLIEDSAPKRTMFSEVKEWKHRRADVLNRFYGMAPCADDPSA